MSRSSERSYGSVCESGVIRAQTMVGGGQGERVSDKRTVGGGGPSIGMEVSPLMARWGGRRRHACR